jgi:hypothetical protein
VRVQDISIVTSHPPTARRTGHHAYLTFEGLSESRTIADKHTRIRIVLPVSEIAGLRDLQAAQLDEPQQ